MNKAFWINKWQKNALGFHKSEPNPLLTTHLKALNLHTGSRLFLPLCGKTKDISWLLSQGYKVVGIELAEQAIDELFNELQIKPTITQLAALKLYQAENIDIFLGDFFNLSQQQLQHIDAIYDRAALVALPNSTRLLYSQHLRTISQSAKQLLVSYEYDQSQIAGPPFAVTEAEIKQLYSSHYHIKLLYSEQVEGGMKGKCKASEKVWRLS